MRYTYLNRIEANTTSRSVDMYSNRQFPNCVWPQTESSCKKKKIYEKEFHLCENEREKASHFHLHGFA